MKNHSSLIVIGKDHLYGVVRDANKISKEELARFGTVKELKVSDIIK